jgi:CheY-like chemotaxis protein
VTDSGVGMASDVVPHVFEPFFTTKGRGRGAGLGLSSVYGLVKQSAGYVYVEHTGADGTRVTVLLPHAAAATSAIAAIATPPPSHARPLGARILLVEDDEGVRELLLDVLESEGFDVDTAATAEQAVERASHRPIDLLLSDIDLPGMSGAELAAHLRQHQPALRVILMSGYPDDGAIERAGLRERPILLRKPFPTPVLLEQVKAALAHADFTQS